MRRVPDSCSAADHAPGMLQLRCEITRWAGPLPQLCIGTGAARSRLSDPSPMARQSTHSANSHADHSNRDIQACPQTPHRCALHRLPRPAGAAAIQHSQASIEPHSIAICTLPSRRRTHPAASAAAAAAAACREVPRGRATMASPAGSEWAGCSAMPLHGMTQHQT